MNFTNLKVGARSGRGSTFVIQAGPMLVVFNPNQGASTYKVASINATRASEIHQPATAGATVKGRESVNRATIQAPRLSSKKDEGTPRRLQRRPMTARRSKPLFARWFKRPESVFSLFAHRRATLDSQDGWHASCMVKIFNPS